MVDFLVENPDTFTLLQVFTYAIGGAASLVMVLIGFVFTATSRSLASLHNGAFLVPLGVIAFLSFSLIGFYPNANIVGNPELDEVLKEEQSCLENKEFLLARGQNVAGLQCSNEYTVKMAQYKCRKTREAMKDTGNDVSGIKCESTS